MNHLMGNSFSHNRSIDGWANIDTQAEVGKKVRKKLKKFEDDHLEEQEEEENKSYDQRLKEGFGSGDYD